MFGKDKKKRSRRVNTKIWPEDFETCEKGNQSCMMAVLCAVILIVMILVSFLMKGNVNIIVGFLFVLHCLHWQFMDSGSDFGV